MISSIADVLRVFNFEILSFDETLLIHRRLIKDFGGETGVLSQEAIENCVALPMLGFFGVAASSTLWTKAAKHLQCIATWYPFIDGNEMWYAIEGRRNYQNQFSCG